ncbi:MAG TPA: hypothetical protein DCO79_03380, partial [Spirochaeta sp.]|nr:hypothetical protein [Spirochaeta sp.]
MKNKLINILMSAAAAIVLIILTSCGAVELTAPTDLSAAEPDSDNPNRISLSWLPVDGADIYYVYRSDSLSGDYSDIGFSVTSASVEIDSGVEELRYLYLNNFEEGEGGTYYYKVTAASNADITL